MSSKDTDPTIVLDTGHPSYVFAVAFHPDGKHLMTGNASGIQRWRLADGQEVGRQTGMCVYAICVSGDHKWIVIGTEKGASVWDEEMVERVIHVEVDWDGGDGRSPLDENWIGAVDVSPDLTAIATGQFGPYSSRAANIWSITSGKRLVGPLEHNNSVTGIKFSPDGERVVTACYGGSIRVFDSRTGDELVTISTTIPEWNVVTPLAWSADGQQILAPSAHDMKIRSFGVLTGSQLAESETLSGDRVVSIAMAVNRRFVATFTQPHSILFLDALTLTQIGPVIKGGGHLESIAISPDGSYLATGLNYGHIIIRDLSKILPDSYGPFHASAREEGQQEVQANEISDSNLQGELGKSSSPKPRRHNKDGDGDLLEVEVGPLMAPALGFNFDEPPSPTQPSGISSAASPSEGRPKQKLGATESSGGLSILKKLWWKKNEKGPGSHMPGRHSENSHQPANHQPRPNPLAKANVINEGPSRMAAGQRKPRTAAGKRKRKPYIGTTASQHPNEGSSNGKQGAANQRLAEPTQQVNNTSQSTATGVHVMYQEASGYSTLAFTFPTWIVCCRSGAHDGTD